MCVQTCGVEYNTVTVLFSVPGVIGTMQALEALKIASGTGSILGVIFIYMLVCP